MIEIGKCGHSKCGCDASENEDYCSIYCQDAGEGMREGDCKCGHSHCADEEEDETE